MSPTYQLMVCCVFGIANCYLSPTRPGHGCFRLLEKVKTQFLSLRASSATIEIPESLRSKLLEYLSIREGKLKNTTSSTEATEGATNAKPKVKKQVNFFVSTFKPSGWYKYDNEIKAIPSSDTTIPEVLHPLSYVELDTYGYSDLIEEVMALGGPMIVGDLMGIEWSEPQYSKYEPLDGAEQGGPEQDYYLDVSGSLSLGSSLDDRLATAEALRLDEVRNQIATISDAKRAYNSNAEEDYKDPNRKLSRQKKVFETVVGSPSNRFVLSNMERLHLVSMTLFSAIAYGRATNEIVDRSMLNGLGSDLGHVSHAVSLLLLSSSILSVVLNTQAAISSKANIGVWIMRSVLGGPASILLLKKLQAENPATDTSEAQLS